MKILDLLLAYGMDITKPCFQNLTPFLYAVRLGNHKIVDLLIKRFLVN